MTIAQAAFDRLAPSYDELAAGNAFQLQRQQTHEALSRWIRPGFRILEIGCGAGHDTEFLARLGARVVACDPSDEMLIRTRRRVANGGVGERVGTLACGLKDVTHFLDALDHHEGFDAVVSNFGALNCAPSLEPLGTIGLRHLRPGGSMAIGLIGTTCLIEWLYFLLKGDRDRATRRHGMPAAVPVAGIDVPTYYHSTPNLAAALGAEFSLDATVGIGVLVPPPYLEPRWQQLPAPIRTAAAGLNRITGSWPCVNRLGDHTLTRWVKRR